MECRHVKVAGLGFRQGVNVASLREALDAAGGSNGLAALASLSDKAATPAITGLASELGLPLRTVSAASLAGVETSTRSALVAAKFGTGSLAEAVALVAAGRNARLLSPRAVSRDRMATAAIAEGDGP